ncbi:MAG: SUMF1/EgtB/PvdO family nonheme iron enzyme [Thermoanaerobaculia bacterium]
MPASSGSARIAARVGPNAEETRPLRGGSWWNDATNLRSAIRNRNRPDNRNDNIGFRVLCAPPNTLDLRGHTVQALSGRLRCRNLDARQFQ